MARRNSIERTSDASLRLVRASRRVSRSSNCEKTLSLVKMQLILDQTHRSNLIDESSQEQVWHYLIKAQSIIRLNYG